MTEQMQKVKLDDSDDVIIIGDVIPKPMIVQEKKKRCRRVKFRDSKYKTKSLIITQKVKVKKRHRRVLGDAKFNETSKRTMGLKNRELSKDEVKANGKRFIPVCSRQTCMDNRWRYEKNGRKKIEKIKTASKLDRDFPRDLGRMLSPISSSPLGNETSIDDEISIDISSLEEDKESKLETLIKRTRDRDRIDQMSRTRRLSTPSRASTANEDMTEDKQMCIDSTSCKPPCTSTPIYEENDNKNTTIASNNNNISEQVKSCNSVSLEDIQFMFSPIKKLEEAISVPDINCQQNIENNNTYISNKNIKQPNKDTTPFSKDIQIKQSEGSVAFQKNYENNIADNKVHISKNNYNERPSVGNNALLNYENLQDEKSVHMQTVSSNSNPEQNIKDINMTITNNNEQLNKNQAAFVFNTNCDEIITQSTMQNSNLNKSQSNTEQNYSETKKSEYIETVLSYTPEQNITDGNMHNSNLNKGQSIIEHEKYPDHPQNNKIEYIQTIVSNSRIDSMMHISDLNEDQLNTKHAHLNHPQNLNSEYIQSVASNSNYDQHIKRNDTVISNNSNFDEQSRKKQFLLFANRQTQQKNSDYVETVVNTKYVQNIDDRKEPITNNNKEQLCKDWVPFLENVKIQHEVPQYIQNFVSNTNNAHKIDERQMSFSFNNHNFPEQTNTGTSPCNDNINIEHNKSEPMNTVVSNTNIDDMDISISYDSPVFEDAHLRHKKSEYMHIADKNTNYEHNSYSQEPISSLSSFIDDIPIQHKECDNINANDFNKKYKQNIEDEMSISYNYLPEQQKCHSNPFFEYTHLQSEYCRHRSVSRSYYEQNNNFTEQHNRNRNIFFEDRRSDYIHAKKQFDQNRYGNMSISYDDKEQQNRAHSPNFRSQHTQFDHTAQSNKIYEQTNRSCSAFFDYIHVEHEKSNYIHTSKKHEQNRDPKTTFSYHNNLDQQNRSNRTFSKDVQIQHKSNYIRAAYSIENYERNIEKTRTHNNNNFNKELARHPSPLLDDVHMQNKKRISTHTDDSKKSYEQNIGDRKMPSFNTNNFEQKPTRSQSHRPFLGNIRRKTNNHTVHSSTYYEKKVERREISRNINNFIGKRNRGSSELFDDNHEYHRKSEYTAISKKKVNIFVDKRMIDEAYEDVLVGLPLGRDASDSF